MITEDADAYPVGVFTLRVLAPSQFATTETLSNHPIDEVPPFCRGIELVGFFLWRSYLEPGGGLKLMPDGAELGHPT
jgi:hypothetical protein